MHGLGNAGNATGEEGRDDSGVNRPATTSVRPRTILAAEKYKVTKRHLAAGQRGSPGYGPLRSAGMLAQSMRRNANVDVDIAAQAGFPLARLVR